MSFCTRCGTKLDVGSAFCTNCGAKLVDESQSGSSIGKANLSSKYNDEHEWNSFFATGTDSLKVSKLARSYSREKKHCIVLTNLQKFRDALGDKYLNFEIALRTYCMGRVADGWRFHLLDLSSNRLGSSNGDTWEGCVDQLRNGVDRLQREGRAKVDAVFIVGDEGIVPMAVFQNPTFNEFAQQLAQLGVPGANNVQHRDKDVDSDLPYSTLSSCDPFLDSSALEIKVKVGRMPSGSLDEGEIALNYFRQVELQKQNNFYSAEGFGISAKCWLGASNIVAEAVNELPVHSCPDFSVEESPELLNQSARFLYFNLHGSDEKENGKWVGDDGKSPYSNTPDALSPHHLQGMEIANVICTEACYGARYSGDTSLNSCLKSALLGKTLAFCGSSRIAWGSNIGVSCADFIARDFLSATKRGDFFGDAFSLARHSLLDSENLTPNDLLTVVEFNLFGDPTLTLPATQSDSSAQGNSYAKSPTGGVGKSALSPRNPLSSVRASLQRSSSNLRIRMPDVLGNVKASLDATWEKINARMVEHIYNAEPALKGVEPQVKLMKLGLGRKEAMQVSVLKKQNNIFIGRTVYTDRSGKILSELCPR